MTIVIFVIIYIHMYICIYVYVSVPRLAQAILFEIGCCAPGGLNTLKADVWPGRARDLGLRCLRVRQQDDRAKVRHVLQTLAMPFKMATFH